MKFIPEIQGYTKVIALKYDCGALSFDTILKAIRITTGIPPISLRKRWAENLEIKELRDIAIFMAARYAHSPTEYLSDYFDVSIPYVENIISHGLAKLDLFLLKKLITAAHKDKEFFYIPIDLETNCLLTKSKLNSYMERFIKSENKTNLPNDFQLKNILKYKWHRISILGSS